MIDKNFYLENLTAFDQLIEYDREAAEKVIYRVYSTLQRDKIWLAANEELSEEEDEEILLDTEQELKELDKQYSFNFKKYHEMVKNQKNELEENIEDSIIPEIIDHLSNEENNIENPLHIEDNESDFKEKTDNNLSHNNIEEILFEDDQYEDEDEDDAV